MLKKADKSANRLQRHKRVRRKITGTTQRPRLCVFRSSNHGGNKEAAKMVGEMIAKRAIEKGITEVVFDRGGYLYHGRVQVLAEAAREAGLKF